MERCARELRLAEEARDGSLAKLACICAAISTGDEHDPRSVVACRELSRDVEAVDAWKLDVEEHDVGLESVDRVERLLSILGEPHDVEPLELEQGASGDAKVGVVVDDQ